MDTVANILIAAAARKPDDVALIDGTRAWTYSSLLDQSSRVAAGLLSVGFKAGDRIATVMQNRAELAILHWATQLAGLVITPLNWRVTGKELDYFVKDSGARGIVFDDVAQDAVHACAVAANRTLITVDLSGRWGLKFDDLQKHAPLVVGDSPDAFTHSVMLYTSGTTGPGKGVPRSHRCERAAAIAHIGQNLVPFRDRTLGVMPLYHTMGVRLLLVMGLVGGIFICQRRFDATTAINLIEEHRVTSLYLVPTLYHDLLANNAFSSEKVASVSRLGFAGASMTDGLLKRLGTSFSPDLIVNHYGSSEIYTFSIDQNAAAKPGSAGKAGLNGELRVVEIALRDPQKTVPVGQEGEIIARLSSDEAFSGYWNRPDADQKSFANGWYFTGDVGYFDKDGDLFVVGRVDDMMISGGENILPVEIESILSLHPSVSEVAVVGLSDERLGHRITAFVVENIETSARELDEWCRRSELARFKCPKDYIFIHQLPRSPVGKLLRRELKEYSSLEKKSLDGDFSSSTKSRP